MTFHAFAVLALLLVVGLACSPTAPRPTPTVSVHDVYPPAMAELLPQEVYNCSIDREIERLERLSPSERADREIQMAASGVPEREMVTLFTQGLSCWALHASDDQYVALMQVTGSLVVMLPSWQLCVEEAMGTLEGVAATSMYVAEGGDRSFFSDAALRCLPDGTDTRIMTGITACGFDRLEEYSSVADRAVDIPELWSTAMFLSCWAVHASDEDYQRYREEHGHNTPAKVLPSWQLCLEDAIGYSAAVEHLYSVLMMPRGSVEFPEVWSQCLPG